MASSYPAALDTIVDNATNDTLTKDTHPTQHNLVADAVMAVEAELGTLPKGTYADVKTRLNDTVVLTPGANQIIQPSGDFVGLSVRASGTQNTANLIDARNHAGTILAYIDRNGNVSAAAFKIAGVPLASTHLSDGASLAMLASPVFTGNPTAPTQTAGNSSTRLATTAFVATGFIALPGSPSGSDVLSWNGSAWTNGKIVNANISASAAIAYSKLTLTTSIVNNDIAAGANIAISKLAGYPTDATKVLKGDGTWGVLTKAAVGGALGTYALPTDNYGGGGSGMLGMGLSITPSSTGKVMVLITSTSQGGWTNVTAEYQIRYGTGSAPVNQAVATGTGAGGNVIQSKFLLDGDNPTSICAYISGLTVGTPYWVDVLMTFIGPPQGSQNPGLSDGSYIITEVG